MITKRSALFTESEIKFAQSFADKTGLYQNSPVSVDSIESKDDTLSVGYFYITKTKGSEIRYSVMGDTNVEFVSYVITTEVQSYSNDIGYDCDVVELGSAKTLTEALRICAHDDLDNKLDNMEF